MHQALSKAILANGPCSHVPLCWDLSTLRWELEKPAPGIMVYSRLAGAVTKKEISQGNEALALPPQGFCC